MDVDFDVIVAGSGAGGGTLAAACASAGKRVLLIERGRVIQSAMSERANGPHNERHSLIEKAYYDDRPIRLGDREAKLYMGGVTGGGTTVYGGALVRPKPEDFEPGRYYSGRIPQELHRWPIEFSELAACFDEAERLYHVVNPDDVHKGPLCPVNNSSATTVNSPLPISGGTGPLPLAVINQKLMQAGWQSGLNPYRLPLAIETEKCLRCDHCAGFPCPTGARRSSAQVVEECISRGNPLTLMQNAEVIRLIRNGASSLDGIEILDRSTGHIQTLRAKRYVLAAGAIGSAALLMQSGFDHPLIGRNYMMHYSPIAAGIFLKRTEADRTFVKQVGLSDYYFGTEELPEKMGIVQSLPAPGPLMMAKAGLSKLPTWLLKAIRAHMLPLVGIVEDLPNPENRVALQDGRRIRLHHRYSEFDVARGRALESKMKFLLRRAGAVYCVGGQIPSQEHVAHQCGTLRFGNDRQFAVADRECRLFDQHDVFVADGSFMPTSLGVGPSLTIISNALRVARRVASEC